MTISNSEIAELFNQYATLLEISGANEFRIRAYRNASRAIEEQSTSMAAIVKNHEDLTQISGIGKDLAGKIQSIVESGKFSHLEEFKKKFPPGLLELIKITNLGPKRIKLLYDQLKITNVEQLKEAIDSKKITQLRGFGEKTVKNIIKSLPELNRSDRRIKLITAEQIAEPLISYLKKLTGVKKIVIAGSYRRRKDTVGDLDLLVTAEKKEDIIQHFIKYKDIKEVISKGLTRSTVTLKSNLQVDLRVVPDRSYGAALLYFTGSKPHNIALRKLAIKKNLKINEYGVFQKNKHIAGKTEAEIYQLLNLDYIDPELREDNGEIAAAFKHNLPKLIELKDIKGDLHVHTKQTDGNCTIEELAQAAIKKDYEYLAITDHSKHLSVAKGLNEKELHKQIEKIDQLNEKLKPFKILKSIEVDILEDGTLDLSDTILKKLDLTVCSIHSHFNLSEKKQTNRILKAMANPYFTILAHPSGRLINKRLAYVVDMDKIIKSAVKNKIFLEINGQPERMDLDEHFCRIAKNGGALFTISSDAHSLKSLDFMRFGVTQARRGWIEKNDIINTRSLRQLMKLLKKS